MINFKIINEGVYIVSDELVSFTFQIVDTPNIKMFGHSLPLKELYIEMQNGKSYLYKEVPDTIISDWEQLLKKIRLQFNIYWRTNLCGFYRYEEVTEIMSVNKSTLEYLLNRYELLQFHEAITVGLWATDRPDKVIDAEDTMFQITKTTSLNGGTRIK